MLSIKNLHISADDTKIVKGINLEINPGEVHAIMGPNGSGKSTLVNALAGHPSLRIDEGEVHFCDDVILRRAQDDTQEITLESHERAQRGLFLAFQYPKEISGVSLRDFLFAAANSVRTARDPDVKRLSPFQFQKELTGLMKKLHIDPTFAERSVNQGFSGGEKKKVEILQMHVLQPKLALLDETDSGLDVDALKVVAEGVNALRNPEFSAVVVTHYARILEYIKPDFVHVMVDGEIKESGGPELAHELEKSGYAKYGSRERRGSIVLETE